jgi:hypothetical protein
MPLREAVVLHYIYTTNIIQKCQGHTTNFFKEVREQGYLMVVLPSLIRVGVNYSLSLRRWALQNCSANATAR